MPNLDCIERPLARFFYRYGCWSCKNPYILILLPIFSTIALSTGFLYLDPITDAIYLFTPLNAQSKMERQVIHDLWPLVNGSYIPGRAVTQSREVQVTVSSRGGGNILEKPYSEAVYRLDLFIQNRVKVRHDGRTYYYRDLCLTWRRQGCPGNKHVQVISDLYQHGFNITYPTVRFGNTNGYIGGSLGGVSAAYGKADKMILASAKSWLMVYHLQFYPPNISYISGLWEKAFQRAMENYRADPYITFTYFHSQTLAEELKRNADSLIPRFVLAFTILIFFSLLCNLSTCSSNGYIDWVESKPVLAVLGVVNAGMGIATAIGALLLLSVPYNDIVGVMPFLVVAVGVDNMFLMVCAVKRTNRAYDYSQRMGEAMSDAAISILITSLTDAFSFGVGAITSIPAVQIFCIYTCAALAITFVYQLTFFTGLLALAIRTESYGLHCVMLKPTIPEKLAPSCTLAQRLLWLGSRADPDPQNIKHNLKESSATLFFQDWYGPVLMQPAVRFLAALWYFVYLAFAVYGCMQLKEGLEPVNLLVSDSYAIPHYRVLERYFWHYGAPVQVVVNNAPDLRDPEERLRVKSMIHAFANNRHTIGDDSVQFWLLEMERYYQKELGAPLRDEHSDQFYRLAQHFFSAKSSEFWPEDVRWGTRIPVRGTNKTVLAIKSFRFIVGLRDISSSVEQQDATATLREVASRYPAYNITTFMPLWLFTDQYALVVPNTVQNIIIAMIVMIIIAVLLIPQPTCALWIALCIASIDVGVIGFMTLWGVNLDAISMITIIMSIGFSVDYSAHIAYGYVVSELSTPRDRIRRALGALGWPITQGALSTILAVIVLADVPAYMIVTFFKTVFLAIALGLLHGLVFLPVALSLFVRSAGSERRKCTSHFSNSTLVSSASTITTSPSSFELMKRSGDAGERTNSWTKRARLSATGEQPCVPNRQQMVLIVGLLRFSCKADAEGKIKGVATGRYVF